MRMCSIASGSSGNCVYIGSDRTHLLVDTGISKKKVEEGLAHLELSGGDVSGLLITHEHADHIQGLGVFSRKYHIPIYATRGTIDGILQSKSVGAIDPELFCEIQQDVPFTVNDLRIHPFGLSHDAAQPCGFRVEDARSSAAVATDMGCYDRNTVEALRGLDALLLEANHDIHMVEVGAYPYQLKQRILGERGHLSNETSGRLLCEILHDRMKYIMLGHLSKENNFEQLAYETVKLEVTLSDVPYKGEDLPMFVANRDGCSRVLEL